MQKKVQIKKWGFLGCFFFFLVMCFNFMEVEAYDPSSVPVYYTLCTYSLPADTYVSNKQLGHESIVRFLYKENQLYAMDVNYRGGLAKYYGGYMEDPDLGDVYKISWNLSGVYEKMKKISSYTCPTEFRYNAYFEGGPAVGDLAKITQNNTKTEMVYRLKNTDQKDQLYRASSLECEYQPMDGRTDYLKKLDVIKKFPHTCVDNRCDYNGLTVTLGAGSYKSFGIRAANDGDTFNGETKLLGWLYNEKEIGFNTLMENYTAPYRHSPVDSILRSLEYTVTGQCPPYLLTSFGEGSYLATSYVGWDGGSSSNLIGWDDRYLILKYNNDKKCTSQMNAYKSQWSAIQNLLILKFNDLLNYYAPKTGFVNDATTPIQDFDNEEHIFLNQAKNSDGSYKIDVMNKALSDYNKALVSFNSLMKEVNENTNDCISNEKYMADKEKLNKDLEKFRESKTSKRSNYINRFVNALRSLNLTDDQKQMLEETMTNIEENTLKLNSYEFEWKGQTVPNTCEGILGPKAVKFLKKIFSIVCIFVPIILMGLGVMDFSKAVIASDQDALKKATSTFVKRCLIAVAIFFLPFIVDLIFTLPGVKDMVKSSTCIQ